MSYQLVRQWFDNFVLTNKRKPRKEEMPEDIGKAYKAYKEGQAKAGNKEGSTKIDDSQNSQSLLLQGKRYGKSSSNVDDILAKRKNSFAEALWLTQNGQGNSLIRKHLVRDNKKQSENLQTDNIKTPPKPTRQPLTAKGVDAAPLTKASLASQVLSPTALRIPPAKLERPRFTPSKAARTLHTLAKGPSIASRLPPAKREALIEATQARIPVPFTVEPGPGTDAECGMSSLEENKASSGTDAAELANPRWPMETAGAEVLVEAPGLGCGTQMSATDAAQVVLGSESQAAKPQLVDISAAKAFIDKLPLNPSAPPASGERLVAEAHGKISSPGVAIEHSPAPESTTQPQQAGLCAVKHFSRQKHTKGNADSTPNVVPPQVFLDEFYLPPDEDESKGNPAEVGGSKRKWNSQASRGIAKKSKAAASVNAADEDDEVSAGLSDSDCSDNTKNPKSQAAAPKKKKQAPKQRSNFVRMDSKGGRGKFKSRAGARSKKAAHRSSRFSVKIVAQAGDGADYMDGWEPKRGSKCFKCGKAGHWAKDCPGVARLKLQGIEDPSRSAVGSEHDQPQSNQTRVGGEDLASGAEIDQEKLAAETEEVAALAAAVQRAREADGSEEALQDILTRVFKHESFRGSQLEVIRRTLLGKSTLAILPTGAGKSLCYQLPALLTGGTTLVVSPLVALMRDQLNHLPPELPAAMLWSGQQKQEARGILQSLSEGKLRVLFVAPERLPNQLLLQALKPVLPLPLVVVDEAHCVAEWGHNFRSAYFRLGHLLHEKVPCRAVLALTATATKATERSIAEVLEIPQDGVIRGSLLPPNLRLSVKYVNPGLQGSVKPALLKQIKEGNKHTTTIVYTTYQFQADEVANYLYQNGVAANSYHAGKRDQERERIQEEFCQGKLRVVVATVAFGMGLDAMHVRSVIHMSLPRSLEEYVQQVGRAGRNREEADCHVFLCDSDFQRLRSLSHAEDLDVCQVKQLLEEVFEADHTVTSLRARRKREGPDGQFGLLATVKMSQQLDMKEEVMTTLLSYLEAYNGDLLRVLQPTRMTVKVAFYADAPNELAKKYQVIEAVLAISKPSQGCYTAPLAALANFLAVPPSMVLTDLMSLAKEEQIRFEMGDQQALAFEILSRPADLDELAEQMAARHQRASRQQVVRLDTAYRAFAAACKVQESGQQERLLRDEIAEYFSQEQVAGLEGAADDLPLKPAAPVVSMDCRALLLQLKKRGIQDFGNTARVIARILHGLPSPRYPAKDWKTCGFWSRYTDLAFASVLRIAERACTTQNN